MVHLLVLPYGEPGDGHYQSQRGVFELMHSDFDEQTEDPLCSPLSIGHINMSEPDLPFTLHPASPGYPLTIYLTVV
jgi:hypothetical protein